MLTVANINGMSDFSAMHANFVRAIVDGGGRSTTAAITTAFAIISEIKYKIIEGARMELVLGLLLLNHEKHLGKRRDPSSRFATSCSRTHH